MDKTHIIRNRLFLPVNKDIDLMLQDHVHFVLHLFLKND